MCSSEWFQALDKLVSCLHCLGWLFSLSKISLWKDAVFSEAFQNASVFEKASEPHGGEYRRHRSLYLNVVTSICGVGIIVTGTLLQWFVKH